MIVSTYDFFSPPGFIIKIKEPNSQACRCTNIFSIMRVTGTGLHKGTIENSESMFPKEKAGGEEKPQMTKECNCLSLKHICSLATENLLEHCVSVQVVTKFGQS